MNVVIFDLDDTLFDRCGQLDETYANLPNIKPFPETKKVLLAPGFKKALVSRGDPVIQQKKIDVLGIRAFFDDIFVCNTVEEKKELFEKIARKHKAKKGEVFIVGDRIDSEIRYGNMLGFVTILLKHGKYKDLKPKDEFEVPTFTIQNLKQVVDICKL
jgi:putative hydrolase of the HAD superfamily